MNSDLDILPFPLDQSVLATLAEDVADNDPDIMLELIDIFMHDSEEHLEGIRLAMDRGDYRHIEISAHSLKSSAATFGAMAFSELCFRLEQCAHSRQTDRFPEVVAAMRQELTSVNQALADERAKWAEAARE
ncbi:MAG: Hpt domain-containing protein [Caldilineaceae bacterium]